MGLRAGLDWCEKSRPNGIRSPDRPARRQSLYRLRYPAHGLINYQRLFQADTFAYFEPKICAYFGLKCLAYFEPTYFTYSRATMFAYFNTNFTSPFLQQTVRSLLFASSQVQIPCLCCRKFSSRILTRNHDGIHKDEGNSYTGLRHEVAACRT